MLDLGVIEESQSAWSSPVTLVKKPNGKSRLCLDARKVNSVTVPDAFPLPLIDGLLSRLQETNFISAIDLKDAFWQIPLATASRDKTAFAVPGRPLYQFTVLPFGLCNAPQTMCKLMCKVIPHQLHDRVSVYLDDLLITSSTFDEHVELLSTVAALLRNAGLTINVEKSKFCMREVRYLGFVVGDGCLRADPEKVAAIRSFPRPSSVKKIRSFLGVCGWYRRFIPQFATIASPLTDLLKKNVKLIWNDEAEKAFDQLKECLTTAPVLANPDFSRPFFIQCDASTTGVGSVLFQQSPNGDEHPIAFMSQKLNAAQRNYSITELECLAAVLSVKRFRPYVEGLEFTIITDHASLKWLMDQRDLCGRLARWSLKLQAFNFHIEYRKGKDNIVADALSRVFIDEPVVDALHDFKVQTSVDSNKEIHSLNLESPAFQDKEYLDKIEKFTGHPETFTNIKITNGRIYISFASPRNCISDSSTVWKLWVPDSLAISCIEQEHSPPMSSHFGIAKTLEKLRRHLYWPNMTTDVRRFILSCETCKQVKPFNSTPRPPLGERRITDLPWQRIFCDFLGPYPRSRTGNKYIFLVLDHLSKFVFIKAMPEATASRVVKFLEQEIFHVFGVPEYLHSDNGSQFVSRLFSQLLEKYGVKHNLSPSYSPQSNASERVNQSILAAIRSYIGSEHRNWDEHLSEIGFAIRSVVHDSTKCSPYFLMFGMHPVTHGSSYPLLRELSSNLEGTLEHIPVSHKLQMIREDVKIHLAEAYRKYSTGYNLRTRPRTFAKGQTVFVRNHVQSKATDGFAAKLAPKFIKAVIVENIGKVSYRLQSPEGLPLGVFHAQDIKL